MAWEEADSFSLCQVAISSFDSLFQILANDSLLIQALIMVLAHALACKTYGLAQPKDDHFTARKLRSWRRRELRATNRAVRK